MTEVLTPKDISKWVAEPRDPLAEAVLKITEAVIAHDHLSLGELTDAIGKEGPTLAAALLCLPFLQPIPLPGLSTPLGLTIGLSGVGLFLQREVKLPEKLRKISLPTSSILKAAEFLARFEVKLKPYLKSDTTLDSKLTRRILGLAIASHGLFLALPLPIPFSNMVPAWMCFLASLTVLFASRRLFWVSILFLLINVAFWTTLIIAALEGSHSLVEWLAVTL